MDASPTCPLCSYPTLRHIRAGKIYWLCQRCRQEVPTIPVDVHSNSLQSCHMDVPKICTIEFSNSLEHYLESYLK